MVSFLGGIRLKKSKKDLKNKIINATAYLQCLWYWTNLLDIDLFRSTGVKIREHKFLTGHKFTNLIKSVSLFMTIIHSKGNFSLVSLLKHQNEKLFLKKFQNLFNSHIFFFMHAACTAILSLNWKNNNTYHICSIQNSDNKKT